MNYLNGSKRGFSVISSLLGFSLLGLSTIGLATYMGSFEQVKVAYSNQSNINFMHNELISGMSKTLTATQMHIRGGVLQEQAKKKQFGLCFMVLHTDAVSYSDVKDKAICPLITKGSVIYDTHHGGRYARNDRLKYFLSQKWEILHDLQSCGNGQNGFSGSFTTGSPANEFNKCVKYNGSTQATGDIFARLTMEPQQLPSFRKIKSTDTDIPIDELVFKMQSVISVPRRLETGDTVYSLSKSEKYLWSTEVLDCHICNNNNECKLARLSASVHGTAARHSQICYHSAYKIKDKNSALTVKFEKIPPKFKQTSGKIVKDTQDNYSAACRSNLFRCGGAVDKNDFDPALRFQFLLDYDQPQDSFIESINLQVKGGSPATTFSHRNLLVPADQKAQVGRGRYVAKFSDPAPNRGENPTWPLRAGSNQITAFVADRKGAGNSQVSMCTNICGQTPVTPSPNYLPTVNVLYGGNQCDVGGQNDGFCKRYEASNPPIACFRCNMKSCHRRGINTHTGSHAARSSEPLDGVVPECAVEKSISVTPDMTAVSGAPSKKCLKTAASGLQAVDCGTGDSGGYNKGSLNNKSACFLDGKTQILKGGHSDSISAHKNCQQALSERQLAGSPDEDGAWREGILPSLSLAYNLDITDGSPGCSPTPPDGLSVKEFLECDGKIDLSLETRSDEGVVKKYYTFENYARYSAFLGDHKDSSLAGQAGVFVPIQRDAGGMFHSGWVQAHTHKKDRRAYFHREPFNNISFHDANAVKVVNNNDASKDLNELPKDYSRGQFLGRSRPIRPTYIKMSESIVDALPSVSNAVLDENRRLVLIHHWAFKGIQHAKKNLGSTSYPYLCRNLKADTYKNAFVTTSAAGSEMKHGYTHCRALNTDSDSDGDFFDETEYWVFAPPDSRELWASALQAVAPNAPRYPFPNPFKFPDGIPFWKNAFAGGKRQWALSYNYNDMSFNDYLESNKYDNIMAFTNDQLASPSAAWIGGLVPNDTNTDGDASTTGDNGTVTKAKSWTWKPDWENILLASSASEPRCLHSPRPAGILCPKDKVSEEASNTSILFDNNLQSSSATSLLTQLGQNRDNNTDLVSDIGVLSRNGRPLSVLALRAANSLPEFKNVLKLCRYNNSMGKLDLHQALMILGKDGNWPSNGNCSSFTTSNSQSSLQNSGVKSPYFKLHSNPETSNLKNLTASDFPKINKGIRSIIPLIAYHHMNARHVQNTDKFCRAWKREKKRRAVGNCLVKGYNNDSLSIGGNTHGIGITRTQRASNSCHPNNKNCSNANSHFQTALTAVNNRITAAQLEKTTKENRKNTITSTDLPNARSELTRITNENQSSCSRPCPACTPGSCSQPGRRTATGGRFPDGQCLWCGPKPANRASCPWRSSCFVENCRADTPPQDCTANNSCRVACTLIDNAQTVVTNLINEKDRLTTEIAALETEITKLNELKTCATPKVAAITTSSCISGINKELHSQNYMDSSLSSSCGSKTYFQTYFKSLAITFDEDALDSRCWSLEKLNPKYTFTFNDGVTNNLSGTIGVIGDTNQDTDWDKNAACNTLPAPNSLYSIPAQCSGHYKDLIDLTDNDLCNDDGINYSSQTCTIP